MKSLLIIPLLLGFIELVQCSPAPVPELVERATCNKDNLLNAFLNPTHSAEATTFCSAYISIPASSTVVKYSGVCTLSTYSLYLGLLHPLYLYNLQPLSGTPSPISYNSVSPSPSTVPGGAQFYAYPTYNREKRDSPTVAAVPEQAAITASPTIPPQDLLKRAGSAKQPAWLATTYPPSRISSACSCLSIPASYQETTTIASYTQVTTTTCTAYETAAVATYAAICAPSLQANAPQPSSHANYKVVPAFSVPSKLDCCAACTNVFNCMWWKFEFGTPGNGWAPGKCHYAYYTGKKGDVPGSEAPAVCPNGITQAINGSYPFGRTIGDEANNNHPGYNFGPCGNGPNAFESAQDFGYPIDDYQTNCAYVAPPQLGGDCSSGF